LIPNGLTFLIIYKRRMNTEGKALDSAAVGRKLTAENAADAIKTS
jgi:CO dehydrogenase/acetyl-CoA synthase gamma subunit (corrinoid Fe-S protein)